MTKIVFMTGLSSPPDKTPSRGDSTRDALIQAATAVFAEQGFHAVTTRLLAQEAGVNQALIGYHFGGKEGLYLAVFDDIAQRMKQRMGPLAEALQETLETADSGSHIDPTEIHLPALLRIIDTMIVLMLSEETKHWAQLILREQQNPTLAFERIYQGFMSKMFALVTQLVKRLRSDLDDVQARLVVVQILGNVLVWRTSRTGVMRQMRWESISDEQVSLVRESVRNSVIALILAEQGGR
jgi:AcrR family transcriptional regulator